MSIHFDSENKVLTLATRNTTYQMQIDPLGYLVHLYYGRRLEGSMEHLAAFPECGFSPNPYENRVERQGSLDLMHQEYSGANSGDFRLSSVHVATEEGALGAQLRYVRHAIWKGKYEVAGMPAAFDRDGEAETLSVTLRDDASGLEAELLYGVFERQDVITRAARLTNTGTGALRLDKAASFCFVGRHTWERQLRRAPLVDGIQEYIKWDMNRSVCDVYSPALPASRQGEVYHRYVLGLYRILDRLTAEFPDVLFEGCSGGGGRFDAGMLAYSPQIWCSDNTDPIERLSIQHGTSFGYPVSSMGSHVSASPNHQTGRTTPLGTRAVVAMAGTFGYEMDLHLLTEGEKEQIREQIQRFHEYYDVIQNGDYFRLDCGKSNHFFTAWQSVSQDKGESLVSVVMSHPCVNGNPICIRLKGLDPEARYVVARQEFFGCQCEDNPCKTGQCYSGSALLYGGYVLMPLTGDYPSVQIHLKKICESRQDLQV